MNPNQPMPGSSNAPNRNDVNLQGFPNRENQNNNHRVTNQPTGNPSVENAVIARNHFDHRTPARFLSSMIIHRASRVPLPLSDDSDPALLPNNDGNRNDDDRPLPNP